MSFPKEKPFNPKISSVPSLGTSSGNPEALQDPNSVASLGLKIQAATDQASADTLYDTPMPKSEGFLSQNRQGVEFRNEIYRPWILGTEACKKEGFKMKIPKSGRRFNGPNRTGAYIFLGLLGLYGIYLSFKRGR